MNIDPTISEYIDISIDRAIKRSIKMIDWKADDKINVAIERAGKITDQKINAAIERSGKITDGKIDIAIERSRKLFKEENDHHLGALKEFFDDRITMIVERFSSLPDRDEVRRIFHEENEKFAAEFSLVKGEVIEHRRRLDRHDKQLLELTG